MGLRIVITTIASLPGPRLFGAVWATLASVRGKFSIARVARCACIDVHIEIR